jgi:hypothetical protein
MTATDYGFGIMWLLTGIIVIFLVVKYADPFEDCDGDFVAWVSSCGLLALAGFVGGFFWWIIIPVGAFVGIMHLVWNVSKHNTKRKDANY